MIDSLLQKQHLNSNTTVELLGKYKRARAKRRKDELRDMIVEGNLRLAANIAGKYLRAHPSSGFEDLFQDAIIGMMVAIEKFDVNLGFKFSTYATWWIHRYVLEGAENATEFKIPQQYRSLANRYGKCREKYGEREEDVVPHFKEFNLQKYSYKYLELLRSVYRSRVSTIELDKKIEGSEREGNDYHEFLADKDAVSPEEECEEQDLKDKLREIMKNVLTEQEQRVIEIRYFSDTMGSIDQASKEIGKHRSRVQQIEAKALRKLRHHGNKLMHDKFVVSKDDKKEYLRVNLPEHLKSEFKGMHIYKVGHEPEKAVTLASPSPTAAAIYFTIHLDCKCDYPPRVFWEDGAIYKGASAWHQWFYNKKISASGSKKLMADLQKTSIMSI